jgi:hypothetical protein
MASDDDVQMDDADLPRFSTVEKGKGKAAEPALPEEDNGLPWYVGSFSYVLDPQRGFTSSGWKSTVR